MVGRNPRQIVGFNVALDKSPERIQKIVDETPQAQVYYSDGWTGYINVIYPSEQRKRQIKHIYGSRG